MNEFSPKLIRRGIIICFSVIASVVLGVLYYMEMVLPDIAALNTTPAQAPLRIYTQDHQLIAEYGERRSNPLPYAAIPPLLINALLATEDQHYFQHGGIDVYGLFRAAGKLLLTGRKDEGGSTITMQVARNFYLSRHKTYGRKLQEILLAIKINHGLTKEKILELYLNTVFLGNRAYGVGAAAQIYYGKPLAALTLPEYAMLAGLPKAPSALNPIVNPVAAKKRRDHVLSRLHELKFITAADYQSALAAPLNASFHELQVAVTAPYAAELARQQAEEMYGAGVYTDGYNVYTTIDSARQAAANQAVRDHTLAYDQRHGYRGPEQNIGTRALQNPAQLTKILANIPPVNGLESAVVTQVAGTTVIAYHAAGKVTLTWRELAWARRQINPDYLGPLPQSAGDIVRPGDVIRIVQINKRWQLAQIPQAQAGLVALDPRNGALQAIVGGFDYQVSSFNRISAAHRQPGSSFKPFIYSAALAQGLTLASIINDGPVVVENPDHSVWRPQNDSHEFYGPTRVREGLVHSRNLVSIRLLQQIGVPYAVDYTKLFGFNHSTLPESLSLALGTASVTPLDLAAGYAVFANGGFQITPYLVASIRNTQNQIIYQANPLLACGNDICSSQHPNENAPRVISAQNAFLITSALHDVIEHGTAAQARALQRNDLAGKTGTTNNQVDAWFVGYNANLVALTWLGFDQPRSLHEYGAQAALPMWMDFIDQALQGQPEHQLPQPAGIVSLPIDPTTGALASDAANPAMIKEYFMQPYLATTAEQLQTATTPPDSQLF